jgi:hypothetical protein
MWTNGTYFTNSSGVQQTAEPGAYVLVTDTNLIPQFSASALRDGQPVARRFSTAAFALPGPTLLAGTGDFGTSNSLFSCTNILWYTNVLNPFVHAYHPDHDNWDDFHVNLLPDGAESFTVTRQVSLQFTGTDNLPVAGWGDNQLGGNYAETITGLHSSTLSVRGTFRLQRACAIGVLNDGIQ